MPVAKSYANLAQASEPYLVNGRMYIKVIMKNGATKQVRWYSDTEYAKLYPAEAPVKKIFRTQRQVLGFEHGYITIFKGDTYDLRHWFKEHNGRYTRWWGWYFQSTDEVPADIPDGIQPVRLEWKDICLSDGENLKNEDAVIAHVETLIYDQGSSNFVGSIGERLELDLVVTKAIELKNDFYGSNSTMHIMEDADENIFVWTTASKSLAEGDCYKMRGTVKDHRIYRNNKQTILTRCSIL